MTNKTIYISPEEALSYRTPLAVTQYIILGHSMYPICPRCNVSIEREYMSYCDRCGQKLDWKDFSHAAKIKNRT